MRFMLMIKATEETEAGGRTELGRFDDELVRAGVLLAGAGLRASSEGARVRLEGGRRTVVDGPFAGTETLIAGFWLIQVGSLAEAIEWGKRCPGRRHEIEIRPVFEADAS